MTLKPNPKIPQPGFGPYIPACFASLEEARNSISYHSNRCLHSATGLLKYALRKNPGKTVIDERYFDEYDKSCKLFKATYQSWSAAFQAFLDQNGGTLDSVSLQAAAVLKIRQLTTDLSVQDHLRFDVNMYVQQGAAARISWDEQRSLCEQIVNLASSVLDMENSLSRERSSSTRTPFFSMDVSIVSPLFTLIVRCRDPALRRRAIALLYSAPRQEGLWHSITTARVCERIMNLEEAGLGVVKTAEDIPICNRICGADMHFDMLGRRGYLKFSRKRAADPQLEASPLVMEVFEEIVEW